MKAAQPGWEQQAALQEEALGEALPWLLLLLLAEALPEPALLAQLEAARASQRHHRQAFKKK